MQQKSHYGIRENSQQFLGRASIIGPGKKILHKMQKYTLRGKKLEK
jgi:hypothetical protein